jgi:L-gulonate 5-dehydrogenase
VLKEAQIIASRVTRGEFPRAIHLMAKGLLHPDLLISQKMALRDITAAFEKVDRDDPQTLKLVLDIQAV